MFCYAVVSSQVPSVAHLGCLSSVTWTADRRCQRAADFICDLFRSYWRVRYPPKDTPLNQLKQDTFNPFLRKWSYQIKYEKEWSWSFKHVYTLVESSFQAVFKAHVASHAINYKTGILFENNGHEMQDNETKLKFLRENHVTSYSWLYFSSRDPLFKFLSKNDAKTLCIEHFLNAKTVTCTEPHDVIHGEWKQHEVR